MRAFAATLMLAAVGGFVACSGSDDASDDPNTVDAHVADAGSKDAPDAKPLDASGAPDTTVADTGTGADAEVDAELVDAEPDAMVSLGSAGCGKAVAPGVTKKTIKVGTLDRTYILSIPTGYDPKTAMPLLFAWHGRKGSAAGFRSNGTSYGGGVEKASAGKAIFVYPDGLPVTSDPTDTGWIDTDPSSRDFALFDALLAKTLADLCIDPKRVFSYGHSFGAFMTEALGCHRANQLRGIGPVAGGPPYQSATCPDSAVAAWIENSKDDPIVDYATRGIPARDYWIEQNGCDATKSSAVSPAPCVAYQGCAAGAPVHWCAPAAEGHAFPSFAYAGIWNFFAAL